MKPNLERPAGSHASPFSPARRRARFGQVDDASLRDALMERDPEALRTVVEHLGPRMQAVVGQVLRDDSLIQDVMQEAFLALWRAPARFDPERGSLSTYLCTVARNKAVDLIRREGRFRRDAAAVEMSTEASPAPSWDDRRVVLDALARLTHLQREALFLAYFGGFTYREVAGILNVPEGTAKTRLRDGLAALRTLLPRSAAA